ncbi:MAG TPA: ABC transporter ATP-binding protein [Candidatus Saccharimonadia bacterium]|nr:ABC transporter ATP-binding protein [Candidatus Saccharimonadia bacterium]
MKACILTHHLSITRENVQILSDVSITVPAGKVVGLLGPSGAGKTTLMQAIVGLLIPTQGRVTVLGRKAGSIDLRNKLGYVTQSPSVYMDLTVSENLRYFGAMVGVSSARVSDLTGDVQLTGHADQLVASLSGGQKARVSLAVALLGQPELLVLDEPTVGLDPVLRKELWGLFHQLADSGVTLLISSHVMDEASRCDDLILLRDGKLLSTGTPAELTKETGTTDVESAFLSLVEKPS